MQATPSTWSMLLAAGWEGKEKLKIICGGETLPRNLANKLLSKCDSLWNMYGPTETTVWSAIYQVEPGKGSVSIGKPIANTQIYLLDSNLEPVPVGVNADIYIGGDGVAMGYLNKPDLTTSRFIPDPFRRGENARLYVTGDTARYLPDGNIAFNGRRDFQVKIRGHRIELGEVEAALNSHPNIRESAVLAITSQSVHFLVAYWVSQDHDQSTSIEELRNFLEESLPNYMIPSQFMELEELPLTPNGKLDRKALPDPSGARPDLYTNYEAPRTDQERSLVELTSRVLGIERVGINDNFFDLGGNSLMATSLIFQINEKYNINLPLLRLFENPTISGLSLAIDNYSISQADDSIPVEEMSMKDMLKEAVIDETIRANGKVYHAIDTPENIFITGATGFLGAYLLQGLLKNSTANIYCHVRASDRNAAKIRLKNNMDLYQLWNDEYVDRIIPVLGDLTQKNLGISSDLLEEIARKIDVIYHNGAIVNFAYPYQALKAANVYSTREILHLASREKIKPVHFVSSVSVLFDGD